MTCVAPSSPEPRDERHRSPSRNGPGPVRTVHCWPPQPRRYHPRLPIGNLSSSPMPGRDSDVVEFLNVAAGATRSTVRNQLVGRDRLRSSNRWRPRAPIRQRHSPSRRMQRTTMRISSPKPGAAQCALCQTCPARARENPAAISSTGLVSRVRQSNGRASNGTLRSGPR